MSDETTHNAQIERISLGLEDHGILTSYISCVFESSGQGFGGFDLRSGNACATFVLGVQRAVGVSDWSDLKNKYCRIKRQGGMIVAIGHIVEDRWFTKEDIFKEGFK